MSVVPADYEDSDLQAPVATECERCARPSSDLKSRNGQLVCWECADEIDLATWFAKDEEPLTGDKALLYADNQAACLIAACEHGTTEEEMLALLRAHIAVCAQCNPASVCYGAKAA